MDGKQMILLCFDAGAEFMDWKPLNFGALTGAYKQQVRYLGALQPFIPMAHTYAHSCHGQ